MNTPQMQLFSQGEIDLVNQRIDLVVAVAPVKTVDWIVRHIPIVGYILGGTLVSIPVKIQGDLYDPTISPLDPAEVGLGFLGIWSGPSTFLLNSSSAFSKTPKNPSRTPPAVHRKQAPHVEVFLSTEDGVRGAFPWIRKKMSL